MKIIYLIGNKQTGKSTHAQWLIDNYGFQVVSFAEPIRDICALIFSKYCGDDQETMKAHLFSGELYNHFKTATVDCGEIKMEGHRRLMEAVGEGVCEYLGKLIFVQTLERKLYEMAGPKADLRVIVDDARKPFEASALDTLGGQGIFLNKPGSDSPPIVTEMCQHNVDSGLIRPSLTVDYKLGIKKSQERIKNFLKI